jgi:hypothetical protein
VAIELEWHDENGKLLARYEGPKIDQRVWSQFPGYGSCLRFIDPFGDTVFNQSQIDVLAAELDAMLIPGQKRAPPEALAAVRQFVGLALGKVRTHLKFSGD